MAPVSTAADSTGATPLYVACQHGRAGLVPLLLASRAQPDAAVGRLGSTPLGIASLKGHLAAVDALTAAGAALELPSKDGATPLYSATRGGQLEVSTGVRYVQGRRPQADAVRGHDPVSRDPHGLGPIRMLPALQCARGLADLLPREQHRRRQDPKVHAQGDLQ